jgi:two-component system chemotaxis sensor kinase CheA
VSDREGECAVKDVQKRTLLLEILGLALEGLERLSGEIDPRGATTLRPVQDALGATRRLLLEPDDVRQEQAAAAARDRLMVTVRQPQAGAPEATAGAPQPGADPSAAAALIDELQQIAGLLVLAEPGDRGRLADVALALWQLTQKATLPEAVQQPLEQALRSLTPLTSGTSDDPARDFRDAARWVDDATFALHEASLDPSVDPPAAAWAPEEKPGSPALPLDSPALPLESPSVATQPAPAAAQGPAPTPQETPQSTALPADADPTLLAEFVAECRDLIENAEAALLTLETNPEDTEAVNTVFRAFHTVKGASGFLGIQLITGLAHRAENLLSRIREKEIQCAGGYADLALRSIDQLNLLIEGVNRALGGALLERPAGYDELMEILVNPEAAGISDDPGQGPMLEPRVGDLLVGANIADREEVEAAAAQQGARPIGEALVQRGVASLSEVGQALRTQRKLTGKAERGADASVRVSTGRLDRLIDMVGELVIAQSMVAQDGLVVGGQNPDLMRKVTHADKIVRELQDLTMSMRMVPLKPTFQKMTRLVRDLAHKGGKQIEFVTSGEDTEIDRNMVDVLNDPLVHMIRNAVDHGIEPPEARQREGKAAPGCVRLSAFHAGGNVVVELQDDGRGLDREKIARKAVERGLIESGKGLTDAEVYNLIFEAGFSTADQVTEISGRGVGMDVVRRAIQSLRGRVEISSHLGRGTTFTVRLPLTLAITDGMLLRVGAQRFILPTTSIHMSFRPEPGAVSTVVGRGEMVMLRGSLVPVIRLHRLFQTPGALEDLNRALLVVIEDGERRAALVVDELLGQQQVVAKSLGDGIGKVPGVSGGAILGDGRVGLILDPAGLGALARAGSSSNQRAALLEPVAV